MCKKQDVSSWSTKLLFSSVHCYLHSAKSQQQLRQCALYFKVDPIMPVSITTLHYYSNHTLFTTALGVWGVGANMVFAKCGTLGDVLHLKNSRNLVVYSDAALEIRLCCHGFFFWERERIGFLLGTFPEKLYLFSLFIIVFFPSSCLECYIVQSHLEVNLGCPRLGRLATVLNVF